MFLQHLSNTVTNVLYHKIQRLTLILHVTLKVSSDSFYNDSTHIYNEVLFSVMCTVSLSEYIKFSHCIY